MSTEKAKGITLILTDNKIVVSDYFIESSYKDTNGKENKYYLKLKDFLDDGEINQSQ
ncbi:hypothetical protein [Oxobacter pfennigii]|uniref:hypothetical protein n=1 Tax=Oxobacter pfennigii TaxID=36849 RepID=UPI00191BCB50|nr:hypothetical protein [Oxobacter pfennigii]